MLVGALHTPFGAATMRALTSAISRYSGSLKRFYRGNCCKLRPLGSIPRGRLLLSTVVLIGLSVTKGGILLHRGLAWVDAVARLLCELWVPTFTASTKRWARPDGNSSPDISSL